MAKRRKISTYKFRYRQEKEIIGYFDWKFLSNTSLFVHLCYILNKCSEPPVLLNEQNRLFISQLHKNNKTKL